MNVTRTSILSNETNTLFIEGLTQDMLDAWHNGALIQEALAGIPLELREFVMTGVTPNEWDEKLGEEPEEEDWDVSDIDNAIGELTTMINFENRLKSISASITSQCKEN